MGFFFLTFLAFSPGFSSSLGWKSTGSASAPARMLSVMKSGATTGMPLAAATRQNSGHSVDEASSKRSPA